MEHISRNAAFELLKKYNKDPFHIQHALTVEAVMKWYANEQAVQERLLNVVHNCSAGNLKNFLQ